MGYLSTNQKWGTNELMWQALNIHGAAPVLNSSLTDPFLLGVGGQYVAAGVTLTDGQMGIMQLDAAGRVKCILDGATFTVTGDDLEIDVSAFRGVTGVDDRQDAWVFAHDADLSAVSEVWQGFGGYDETADRFRAFPIGTDNAPAPADAQGIPVMGEYNATPVTLGDGDFGLMALNLNSQLMVSMNAIYPEDAGHTSGEEGVFILGVRQDSLTSSVDTDADYGAIKFNAKGSQYVDLSSVLGSDMSVTNGGFMQLTDNTTVVKVNTAYTATEAAAQASLFTTGLAMGWNNAGSSLSALEVNVDNAQTNGTPNVLSVGGVYKSALDTYADNDASPLHTNVNGELLVQPKGYDTGTDSLKVYEVAPISTHYVISDIAAASAQGDGTTYYYILMDGFRNLTLHWLDTPGGAGNNTYTLEGSVDPDEAGAGTGDYFDVSTALGGAANWTTDQMVIVDTPVSFKYVRVKVVRAADGGGTDGAWTIHVKKQY